MNSTLLRTAAPVWSAVDDALLLPAATPAGVVVAVDVLGTQDTSALRQDVPASTSVAPTSAAVGAGSTSGAYAGRRSTTSAAHTAATYAAHTSAVRPSFMDIAPPSRGTPV